MGEKEYTIRELILYYVERYNLPLYGSSTHEGEPGIAAYKEEMKRIMKRVRIGRLSFWDAIKPENGWRRVTVAEFEKYCFRDWYRYITKNCQPYDKEALEADKARYEKSMEWIDAANDAIEAENAALEAGFIPGFVDDNDDEILVTQADVEAKKHEMMIEAVYYALYDSFKTPQLRYDMEHCEPIDGSAYNPEYTPEIMQAKARLKDFRNYIGKRKE